MSCRRDRRGADIWDPLVESTPINPYNHVGIWKQRSRLFKRFDVLIFGICHAGARSGSLEIVGYLKAKW